MEFGREHADGSAAHAAGAGWLRVAMATALAMSLAGALPSAAANGRRRSSRRYTRVAAESRRPTAPGAVTGASDGGAPVAGAAGTPAGTDHGRGSAWLSMVSKTQAEQPHWITPLVTVTPRLEQEFRFDISTPEKYGVVTAVLGGGKGLEIVPAPKVEVIIGVPAYNSQQRAGGESGWGDESFLVKYRVFASNETGSNQIVTLFFAASLPSGSVPFSMNHTVFTPTVAYGKGFGSFDVQSTLGMGFPASGVEKLGRPVAWNTALQHHASRYLWPELEVNFMAWQGGVNGGRKQVFITPGLVVGRLPIRNRMGLTLGVGLQVAATKFHTYDHSVIFSFRLPF